ncbi:DarT ssDNA thymidine ADP-ribosyltransferase family protein [Streptomyces sp. NPDC012888]|uniref:DarT ssDNA thymidine ADP-ribosyltransferase family protein n=1 Tax=Streptomyces sp. NPDC012888 TaxID=3364855 RepID=UPI0036C6A5B9
MACDGQERWNNTDEDPDRMRRRMAEYLVHERVPVEAITQLAVRGPRYAEDVRVMLRAHGVPATVDVRPAWYY